MSADMIKVIARGLIATATLCLLQGCAAHYAAPKKDGVAAAFETSGVVSVNPYTRTIFSSTNF